MGRIKQSSLLADFNGAVGNVVVTSWRDQDVIRKKGVRRSTTQSPAQIEQTARFTLAIAFIKEMGNFLEVTFRSRARKMTGKNAATRELLKSAITGVYPNFAIDFPNVKVSAPNGLPEALASAAVSNDPGVIHYTWTDNTLIDPLTKANDKAMLVAYCPSLKRVSYNLAAGERSQGQADLNTPLFAGLQAHTWIVFTTENHKKVSRSVYTGMVNVQ